jgi:uncharacterized HAD superfamily protein
MKQKLKEILKNPNDKLIAVDMDGVICQGEFWGEGDPIPNQEMINRVWTWYKKGAHIIIYTARQPKYYPQTQAWLVKNEVPFHGIVMQVKIGADVYIDDHALNIEDILE